MRNSTMGYRCKKIKSFTILISLFSIFASGCLKEKKVYYENGQLKEENLYDRVSKNLLQTKKFNQDGSLKTMSLYSSDENLTNNIEVMLNGDTVNDIYLENKVMLRTIHFKNGEFLRQPYLNEKINGIERFYSKNELNLKSLRIDNEIVCIERTENIEKGKTLKIISDRYGTVIDENIVLSNSYKMINQLLSKKQDNFLPIGCYFTRISDGKIGPTIGSYVILDLPDTVKINTEFSCKVFGNNWNNSVLIEVKVSEFDNNPFAKEPETYLKSDIGNPVLEFKNKLKIPGYHFLTCFVRLVNSDSKIIQEFVAYDDVIAIP